jgi:hypothetical protein
MIVSGMVTLYESTVEKNIAGVTASTTTAAQRTSATVFAEGRAAIDIRAFVSTLSYED